MFTSGGGGFHFHVHFWGGPLLCSLLGGVHFHAHFWGVHIHVHFRGVHFCVHFWGGPLPCSLLGGPLPCSLLWGPLPCSLLRSPLPCSLMGGVHFHVHFQWGSTSMFTSGGSLVTYPIMLLYTALYNAPVHHGQNSHGIPPPQRVGQTDRETNTCENITFPLYVAGGNNGTYARLYLENCESGIVIVLLYC